MIMKGLLRKERKERRREGGEQRVRCDAIRARLGGGVEREKEIAGRKGGRKRIRIRVWDFIWPSRSCHLRCGPGFFFQEFKLVFQKIVIINFD
jgi:hypothetical protein